MTMTPLSFWFEGGGPTHFYKFRSINEFTKDIIVKQRLFFNSADGFNDPFDFLPVFTMKAPIDALQRYLEGAAPGKNRVERKAFARRILSDPKYPEYEKEAIKVAYTEADTVRKTTGLLSLSSRADHMLLWGHYADSHKGIALRFKPEKGDGYFESACPVTYQRDRPKLNLVLESTVTLHRHGLLTKADYWSYEEEWRIVKGVGSKGSHEFPMTSLDGIVLGAKISQDDERLVRDWANLSGANVEWLRAKVHGEEFALVIEPC